METNSVDKLISKNISTKIKKEIFTNFRNPDQSAKIKSVKI